MLRQLSAGLFVVALMGIFVEARAGIAFRFSESGGNVLMQSSGVIDTSKLVSAPVSAWFMAGIEANTPPNSDIMGDTSMGQVDTAFGFHSGTVLTPWLGTMFTSTNFDWQLSGTTQFTTYFRDANNGNRLTPGFGIGANDLVGSLWTPDVAWSKAGTFASLGLTPGTYTITDIETSEFISIQIGDQDRVVPEPASLALFVIGACAAGHGPLRRLRGRSC